MSTLSTDPYRGTRDFYPQDQWLQNYIFTVWRTTCNRYGYEEYNTPTIEPLELYTAKTSEEIVQEQTYSFEDRGGRLVTIRPEMTPSVARMVAGKRQELGYPLRLFSIPNCMRYERPQKGRLREFWQLNADIFGVESVKADVELIQLADALMKGFGATSEQYTIRVNSRKLINAVAEAAGIGSEQVDEFVRLLDHRTKLASQEFEQQLSRLTKEVELVEVFLAAVSFSELPQQLQEHEGAANLRELMERMESFDNIIMDTTVARGFDYYTDIVFEVFDEHPDNTRSLFGGGRYDNLVGQFGVEPVATAGFGMGDATLVAFLEAHQLVPEYRPDCRLALVPLTENKYAVDELAQELRSHDVSVAVDYSERKTDKMIKTALKHGRQFVLFVGDAELKSGTYGLKNLENGDQQELTIDQIVTFSREARF